MRIKERGILFLMFLFASQILFATGPSSIYARMNPVSVNENGDILFRTRYSTNPMGAHDLHSVEYGLSVWSENELKEFLTKKITPNWQSENRNYDEELRTFAHWDWIFKTGLSFEKLSQQQQDICNKYNFRENNIERYKVNKVYSLADFEKEYGFDPSSKLQRSLKGGKSISFCEKKRINVRYKIGDIFIIENELGIDPDDCVGFEFNYISFQLEKEDIPYEMFLITGVLKK